MASVCYRRTNISEQLTVFVFEVYSSETPKNYLQHVTSQNHHPDVLRSRISNLAVTVWWLPNVAVKLAAFVARTCRLWHSVTVAFRCVITHQPTAWIMTAMDATHIAKVGKTTAHCSEGQGSKLGKGNCQHTLRRNSKEQWPYLHRDGSWNLTS